MVVECAVLDGETIFSNLSKKRKSINKSWEKQEKDASRMLEIEIFQNFLEMDTVAIEIASKKQWMLGTSMQVFNIEENVGLEIHLENMGRDQTVSVTRNAEMTVQELVEAVGEMKSLDLRRYLNQSQQLQFTNQSMVSHTMVASRMLEAEIFQSCSEQATVNQKNALNL